VIAGETRDLAYKARIKNLIEALPPSHVVQWERRFIEECDVHAYFEAADVVVLPYRHIDQSGVLFTAYRFGTPVIASDVGSFREFLPAYAGMIVPTLTPAAFAETVREFKRRKTGFDRARIRHLAESMVWPITVKPLVDAYRAVTR
jgi:glycosyltransferase involved in cell wall biosynthesis